MKIIPLIKRALNSHIVYASTQQARILILGIFFLICFVLILSRYAWLSFIPNALRERLLNQASRQVEVKVALAKSRTPIVDRKGRLLAISVPLPSVFLIPKKMPTDYQTLTELSMSVNFPVAKLLKIAQTKKSFYWLKRQIPIAEYAQMQDLKKWRNFLGVIEEAKRIYPEKDIASHLIGFTNIDNVGIEGVEKIYNLRLQESVQYLQMMRDARGQLVTIKAHQELKPETPAVPLHLSIDAHIQNIVQQSLKTGVLNAQARGGSAIVLDVKSGELLAIASYPTFDLNNPPDAKNQARRFRAVQDALELGSVVKPMFIAKALDSGVLKSEEKIWCENGSFTIPGGVIHDTHPHGFLTPQEIIKYSSNIGIYKVVQRLGRERFHQFLYQIGFARQPGTGIPGEWAGRVSEPAQWKEMRFANMAFGQGIAISPLQMIHALKILTGGGTEQGIHILSQESKISSELIAKETVTPFYGPLLQVIRPSTSRLVTRMMETVVEEEGGTGRRAAIPLVNIAAKTGTAEKYNPKTRSYSERISNFAGVFPAHNPKYAIVVIIDEPQVRPAFGGLLAGPVFADIGTRMLLYLNAQGQIAIHTAASGSSAALMAPDAQR